MLSLDYFCSGSTKMNALISEQFLHRSTLLKEKLSKMCKLTVCLDGWSNKGLSSSFLGISACYFNPATGKPCHSFLNLSEIHHPHTGAMLSTCLSRSLEQ